MSETTDGVELAVPESAHTALHAHLRDLAWKRVGGAGADQTAIRAIAGPVVAAELRRLASIALRDYGEDISSAARTRDAMRRRADELDAS